MASVRPATTTARTAKYLICQFMNRQPINVLLVEDNPGDAFLIPEQLKQANIIRFNLIETSF